MLSAYSRGSTHGNWGIAKWETTSVWKSGTGIQSELRLNMWIERQRNSMRIHWLFWCKSFRWSNDAANAEMARWWWVTGWREGLRDTYKTRINRAIGCFLTDNIIHQLFDRFQSYPQPSKLLHHSFCITTAKSTPLWSSPSPLSAFSSLVPSAHLSSDRTTYPTALMETPAPSTCQVSGLHLTSYNNDWHLVICRWWMQRGLLHDRAGGRTNWSDLCRKMCRYSDLDGDR